MNISCFPNNIKICQNWVELKGMKNRIVHDYGFIDISIVYDSVAFDIFKNVWCVDKNEIRFLKIVILIFGILVLI